MQLSEENLNELTKNSVDPNSWGTDSLTPTRSFNENSHLSDEELITKIVERNKKKKPTYKLRLEYKRRLKSRS